MYLAWTGSEAWENDICFNYNSKSCTGHCMKLHICSDCKLRHRLADCKFALRDNHQQSRASSRHPCNTNININNFNPVTGISGNKNCLCQLSSNRSVLLDEESYIQLELIKGRHLIGGIPTQMKLAAWEKELMLEEDKYLRDFLYDGILNGFSIVDTDSVISSYDCKSYLSATQGQAKTFFDKLICKELNEFKYTRVAEQPYCIHSLGQLKKARKNFVR